MYCVATSQNETPDPQSMGELLEMAGAQPDLRRGETVDGVVMRVDQDGLLVNIGGKSEGLVPAREMRSLTAEDRLNLQVGSSLYAYVLRPESEEGSALLSVDRARSEQGWRVLEKALEADEVVEAALVGANRGGAIVELEGVQGFVPLSHLTPSTRDQLLEMGEDGVPEGDPRQLRLKVLEIDRRRRRAVLSERLAERESREQQKGRLLQELQEGETRKGRVSGISPFGVFVDLGGADGLIHISELSWKPVRAPEEIVHVGEEVDVFVLKIDRDRGRISLSLRRLHAEPWETLAETFHVGQIVTGTVTRLAPFGAFAQVDGAVEGLIHISELSDRRIEHPREVVKEGDMLELRVLHLDPERRRLGLSRKQALEEI
jgi:small subunit ribosomal protein S1